MVMPCSRSARRPSVSSERSSAAGGQVARWLCGPRRAGLRRRPWNRRAGGRSACDLPSSTLPAVVKRSSLGLRRGSSSQSDGRVSAWWPASEVALALLHFHGAFLIVIDHAVLALRAAELNHLFDDLGQRVGLRADGAGAMACSPATACGTSPSAASRRAAAACRAPPGSATRRAPPSAAAWRNTAARWECSPGGCTARHPVRSSWKAGRRGCFRPCRCGC